MTSLEKTSKLQDALKVFEIGISLEPGGKITVEVFPLLINVTVYCNKGDVSSAALLFPPHPSMEVKKAIRAHENNNLFILMSFFNQIHPGLYLASHSKSTTHLLKKGGGMFLS